MLKWKDNMKNYLIEMKEPLQQHLLSLEILDIIHQSKELVLSFNIELNLKKNIWMKLLVAFKLLLIMISLNMKFQFNWLLLMNVIHSRIDQSKREGE